MDSGSREGMWRKAGRKRTKSRKKKKRRRTNSFLKGAEYSCVSTPYNLEHNVHVDFNSATGFSGIPPEWEAMLKSALITKKEVMDNPKQVTSSAHFFSSLSFLMFISDPLSIGV